MRTGHLLPARGLPTDLQEETERRLMWVSLALAVVFAVALVLNNAIDTARWRAYPQLPLQNHIGAAMILVSLLVAGLAHSGRVEPRRLMAIGLVYEVVVAAAISMGDHLEPLSSDRPLLEVSWLCVWIVVFPLIVPARLLWSVLASFAAASTWPLAFLVGLQLGHASPPRSILVLNCLENYIAALIALVPTFILRRLSREVQKARAMGSYELVERLDRGGMGEVWRARHRLLARPAAVKLIRPEMLGATEGKVADALVRRFEREAQATASLHSPHTLELYDFGRARDGTFYYVMELLEGLDLDGLVRKFGPLPAERVVHLLLQACDSLSDAHAVGLVHCDIKPANLYLCCRGLVYDFVKVLDFGLVKAAWTEGSDESRLTQEGSLAGTPGYMAPEIILGEAVDGRVDVYALGCVAYWLLTAHTVFQGGTALQIAMEHVKAEPVPPSRRTSGSVPEALERIILRCLEKRPSQRPASAAELASELVVSGLHAGWTQDRARQWWQANLSEGGHPPSAEPSETWAKTR